MPASPAVELDHVSVAFARPILSDVSLTVATGETVAVVGESGTGKSTLLRLVLGLQLPDSGSVRVMGQELRALGADARRALRAQVGMVFQGAALFDSLDTFENVAFALRERGHLRESEVRGRVRDTLALVDLDPDEGVARAAGTALRRHAQAGGNRARPRGATGPDALR